LGGLEIASVEPLGDVPDLVQAELVRVARQASLALEEELSEQGAVLMLAGEVAICANVSDVAAAKAQAPAILPCWSTSSEAPALKLTSLGETKLVVWPRAQLVELLKDCPWVLEDLDRRADRYSALAGATMGPLGDLDDASRDAVFDRLTLRSLAPGELWLDQGAELTGLAVVGVGELVLRSDAGEHTLGAGELVLPGVVLDAKPSPERIVAGEHGAIVLVATKASTVELFATVPTLVELLRVA
jgi:hypothetical protein